LLGLGLVVCASEKATALDRSGDKASNGGSGRRFFLCWPRSNIAAPLNCMHALRFFALPRESMRGQWRSFENQGPSAIMIIQSDHDVTAVVLSDQRRVRTLDDERDGRPLTREER
jgi:hypothetical protein